MSYSPFSASGQSGSGSWLDALRPQAGRPVPRITVVRTGGIGDTILLLPVLEWLGRQAEGADLTLVGSRWAEELRLLIPFPLTVVRFDSPALTPLFADVAAEDATGVFKRADAVFLYTGDPAGSFARNVTRSCPGPVILWPVVPPGKVHAAQHLAHALGDAAPDAGRLPPPELRVPDGFRTWARDWLEARLGPDARPVAIHPGSGGSAKCWPAEQYAGLAERLVAPVLLLEGPADAKACGRLRALLPAARPTVQAAGLSLPQAAALLERCALYVGNDSGISHVAAALGLPTVAVFGPTDPSVWGPLGQRVVHVRSPNRGAWPTLEEVLAAASALPRIPLDTGSRLA